MKLRKIFSFAIFINVITLFNLCFCNKALSQFNLVKPESNSAQQKGVSVQCKISYIISVPGKTQWILLTALKPESLPDIQKIERVEYSIKPVGFFQRNGNRYEQFVIKNPGRIEKLDVIVYAELYRYDLQTAKENKVKNQYSVLLDNLITDKKETGLDEFLKEEPFIEKNDENILEVAQSITGNTEIQVVRNIYDYVIDNMEYLVQGKRDRGAVNALRHKKGDCSEYSDLFVALCRAKNIPARVVTGIYVQPDTKTAKHNWAEVYLKDFGWVPFDPTKGDVRFTVLRDKLFSTLKPAYIYFSHIRNDNILNGYHYCVFTYFGDRINVSDSIKFEFPKQSD